MRAGVGWLCSSQGVWSSIYAFRGAVRTRTMFVRALHGENSLPHHGNRLITMPCHHGCGGELMCFSLPCNLGPTQKSRCVFKPNGDQVHPQSEGVSPDTCEHFHSSRIEEKPAEHECGPQNHLLNHVGALLSIGFSFRDQLPASLPCSK